MAEQKKSRWKLWGILTLVLVVIMAPLAIAMFVVVLISPSDASQCQDSSAVVSDSEDGSQVIHVPEEFKKLIKDAATVSGLPEQIIAAQIDAESGFDVNATSPAGAMGPAQFMPETWKLYGEGGDPRDPGDAMAAYGRYMSALKEEVQGIAGDDADYLVKLTLAAYNAGPGAVIEHQGIPPFTETQNYVKKITGDSQMKFSADCEAVAGTGVWDGDLGDGEWTNPCPGCVFTSGYGRRNVPGLPDWAQMHMGVDLATPGAGHGDGGPIVTPVDMKVVGFIRNDGCVVTRQTGDPGFGFAFCHLNRIDVAEGQQLKRGDIIGIEGNHAGSVGGGVATHLHLEIYKPHCGGKMNYPYDGCNINPEPILKEKGAWVK